MQLEHQQLHHKRHCRRCGNAANGIVATCVKCYSVTFECERVQQMGSTNESFGFGSWGPGWTHPVRQGDRIARSQHADGRDGLAGHTAFVLGGVGVTVKQPCIVSSTPLTPRLAGSMAGEGRA